MEAVLISCVREAMARYTVKVVDRGEGERRRGSWKGICFACATTGSPSREACFFALAFQSPIDGDMPLSLCALAAAQQVACSKRNQSPFCRKQGVQTLQQHPRLGRFFLSGCPSGSNCSRKRGTETEAKLGIARLLGFTTFVVFSLPDRKSVV